MGTPHQGSVLVPWAMMVSHIANVAFAGQAVRTDLIAALKTGSPVLADISTAFVPHSKLFKIMSFIETQIERPLPALVRRLFCPWQRKEADTMARSSRSIRRG